MTAPILVLGAHRSGTSVLNRVLGELGVFTGCRRDPNDEAWFFLRLNEWLLRQAGARWDQPAPIDALLAHDTIRGLVVDYLRLSLDSPRSISFLGLARFLRYRSVRRFDGPWGFKDPRSSFTLPLWLELFPAAKVLHIHRRGVDVAASLRARERRHLERSMRRYPRLRVPLQVLPKRAGFTASPRCSTLEGAFTLWECYVTEARQHVRRLGSQALELRYEDLTADPGTVVEQVAAFCELAPTTAQRARAAGLLRSERPRSSQEEAELAAFERQVAERTVLTAAGEQA